MFQKRRNFIVTLFSSFTLVNKLTSAWDGKGGDQCYKVHYECLFRGTNINHESFEKDRLIWEKPAEMVTYIQKYVSEKVILDSSFEISENGIKWSYLFLNRASFEKFNKEVFIAGYFDQQKVLKGYEYKLSGEYV